MVIWFVDIKCANISINQTAVLGKVVQDMHLIASDEQTLDLDVSVQEVSINADSLRMNEVVQNLISNAIKYLPKNNKLLACLSSNYSKARIEVINESGGVPRRRLIFSFKYIKKYRHSQQRANKHRSGFVYL
jgi:signal transduction histidine kinase